MPTEAQPQFPPYRLADALRQVYQKGEDYRDAVNRFNTANDGYFRATEAKLMLLCDKIDETSTVLMAAIDTAVQAIPGVDYYMRLARRTRRGQWSSSLKEALLHFRWSVSSDSWRSLRNR